MKKIKDLEAQDFPDVNIDKFQKWKNAQTKFIKQSNIFSYVVLALLLIAGITKALLPFILFGIGFTSLVVYVIPKFIKINKLRKEANITQKDLRKAMKK